MPRAALTQTDIDAFRERIIAAGTRLFAEYGYEGVTLRGISAELGCSPMTPYRYFKGKEEIFASVRTAVYERFAAAQEEASRAVDDPMERLARLGDAYVRFAFDEPDAYRIMFELHQDTEGDYPALEAVTERTWAPMRRAVGDAITAGVLQGDPDVVAHILWAGLHGVISLHLAGKLIMGVPVEELIGAMTAATLKGNVPEGGLKEEEK